MLHLNYTIEANDYVQYYTYMYWDDKKRKKIRLRNTAKQIAYNILFCGILFYSSFAGRNNKYIILISSLIFAITLLSFIGGKNALRTEALKVANDEDNASIFTNYNLVVSNDEIIIKTSFLESKYYWKAFIKKIEIEDYYFLFTNTLQAVLIPKRAFINDTEQAAFDKILTQNLSLDAEFKDA